jgi:hypothetical protein
VASLRQTWHPFELQDQAQELGAERFDVDQNLDLNLVVYFGCVLQRTRISQVPPLGYQGLWRGGLFLSGRHRIALYSFRNNSGSFATLAAIGPPSRGKVASPLIVVKEGDDLLRATRYGLMILRYAVTQSMRRFIGLDGHHRNVACMLLRQWTRSIARSRSFNRPIDYGRSWRRV